MLEFKQLDNRPTHELKEVITLDDLRKAKQEREQANAEGVRTHRAAIWLPKKQKGADGSDGQPTPQAGKDASFMPTAAARQQLAAEKPATLQRMEDTVTRCRLARDNRNYRMNSLGVFEDDKNEVRARSMQRVQVHKDLSTTSMRLPDTNKDIKVERPNNSVEAKLERMCNRVIASLPEQPPKATPAGAPRFAKQTTARTLSPRLSAALRSACEPAGSEGSSAELLNNRMSRTSTLAQGLPARGLAIPSQKATATNMSLAGGLAAEPPRDAIKDSLKSTASRAPPLHMASHRGVHAAPDQQSVASHHSNRPRNRTRPRSAGPLKFSPFTTSLGAGTGLAPSRPKSIFRPKKEPDQPVYGRRRVQAVEHTRRPSSTGRLSTTGDVVGAYTGTGNLPNGLAQAHNRYLDAATEENVARYYKLVSDAQLASLQRHNLSSAVLGMSPEQLQEALETQLKAERMELEEESQRQNRVASGALNPASSSSLAQSALEHCSLMNEELDVLKKSLPDTGPKYHGRRKKPSIPMSQGGKSMAGLGSGTHPGAGSDTQSETGRTYGASEISDWEGDGRAIAGSDGDVLAGWALPDDPSGLAGLSFLRKHEQQRRNELLRPPRSSRPGAVEGGAAEGEEEADLQNADSVRESQEQHGQEQVAEGKRELQEHQTFSTKRLNAFKTMLDEAEAVPMEEVARMMPALPSVPTSPSMPLHIQTRLERLWTLLQMPLPSRLDAVLEYTKHSRLLQFEHALKVWEQAAVAVLQREGMIDTLLMVQKGVEEGTIGYLTVSALERQCVRLVQITSYLEQLKSVLREQYCIELTYQGKPYPDETQVSQDQLLEFMEWLKDSSDSVVCLS